eukprot:192919-Chlamydomonas_euryale.AAC.2
MGCSPEAEPRHVVVLSQSAIHVWVSNGTGVPNVSLVACTCAHVCEGVDMWGVDMRGVAARKPSQGTELCRGALHAFCDVRARGLEEEEHYTSIPPSPVVWQVCTVWQVCRVWQVCTVWEGR